MGSRHKVLIHRMWLSFAGLLIVIPQSSTSEAPPTLRQELTRLGIPLKKPSLILALRNAKPEVRGLAAAELAEMKAVETLPEILRAANGERVELTQVNIAAAVTWLGSSEGVSLLVRMCQNRSLQPYTRQSAARNAFEAGNHDCYASMAAMMSPSATAAERIGAMYLLTQLPGRTREQSEDVLHLILPMLAEPDLQLRLEACQGLRFLGNPAAIAPLREALLKEPEETIRQQMQATLDSIAKKS